MTESQRVRVREILGNKKGILHHGACHGADREAHSLANLMRKQMWPSNQEQLDWALKNEAEGDFTNFMMPPLQRNKKIVEEAMIVIATPAEANEVLRSGTWATIRYALKRSTSLYTIFPSGAVRQDFVHGGFLP